MKATLPLVVFAALLASASPVAAQLPVAPPPHPALETLVKEYQRLGLPLPPKDAELVRIIHSDTSIWIAFRTPPKTRLGYPEMLAGLHAFVADKGRPIEEIVPCDPLRPDEVLKDADLDYERVLPLAVQCKLRGWDELAHTLYRKLRNGEFFPDRGLAPLECLHWHAECYWGERLFQPGTDRREAYRRLKMFPNGTDLKGLELALAPRKSKPGTTESLIDDLTEDWRPHRYDAIDEQKESGQTAFNALVALGFDAVPLLIEHFDDERYTRAIELFPTSFGFGSRPRTVGDAAREILGGLAGKRLNTKKEAAEWWAGAKRLDEKKWLLEHTDPPYSELKGISLQAIGAKYPRELPELLKRGPACPVIRAIVLGKLPREEKLALLEEGLKRDMDAALRGLRMIDRDRFHKKLVDVLRQRPKEIDGLLVVSATSEECWNELARYVRGLDASDRQSWSGWAAYQPEFREVDDSARVLRIRFLLKFLDDTDGSWSEGLVCDTAAVYLLWLLTPSGELGLRAFVSSESGFIEKVVVRALAARLAAEELRRLGKTP